MNDSHDEKQLANNVDSEDQLTATQRKIQLKIDQINSKKTILVIDDELELLELIEFNLTEAGYNVIVANSVKSGIENLHSHSDISLILVDLGMPKVSGFDLLEYLKNNLRFKNIPTIVVSGNSNVDVVTKTASYKVSGYLSKPFHKEVLISKIQNVFENEWNKILVVSSDFIITNIVTTILIRGNYKPSTARTGEDALNIVKIENINAVISDVILEDMVCFDLLGKVNEISTGIPVLFFTNNSGRFTEQEILDAGGHGLIKTPFNNIELLNRLKSIKQSLR